MALIETVTDEEEKVIFLLGSAWNAFLLLEANHPDEQTEFRHGIHNLQHIILSRAGSRLLTTKVEMRAKSKAESLLGKEKPDGD